MTGAKDLDELIEGVYLNRYAYSSEIARTVFEVAAEGDEAAREIVRWAGSELGDMTCGVIRQLEFESLDFGVVLIGSIYDGDPMIIECMRETIHTVAPGARLVRLNAPPVVGSVLLGMEQAGAPFTAVRKKLIDSAAELV